MECFAEYILWVLFRDNEFQMNNELIGPSTIHFWDAVLLLLLPYKYLIKFLVMKSRYWLGLKK